MAWFGRQRYGELKDFSHEMARGTLVRRYARGLSLVSVAKVVGSVGKAQSMDRRFRYKSGAVDARLRSLRRGNAWGMLTTPPVDLYQINDEYYVVDGHHRLAIALENGQVDIDANVVAHEVVFPPEAESAPRPTSWLSRWLRRRNA